MDGNRDSVVSGEPVPNVAEQVRSVSSPDGGAVLDLQRGQIYRLNSTGAMVLELIKDGKHERQIADLFANRLNVTREIAEADVRTFMARLQASGLIDY